MSSGQSSDQVIKQEILENIGDVNQLSLRIFPDSSNDDQLMFAQGGLTFGVNGVLYGSCDAAWVLSDIDYIDPFDGRTSKGFPVVALEGTDALQRGSTGNAQYQRFHHALGIVKGGGIGIYYLKRGDANLQLDLFRMAYCASRLESGAYLITQDLSEVATILKIISEYGYYSAELERVVENKLNEMNSIWLNDRFIHDYDSSMQIFADRRSTIILDDLAIKYAGRMRRNFTDPSQRAGHIAVGEMYLSKYLFSDKQIKYLFPRMTSNDIRYLDVNKSEDKEWKLLRNEVGVEIITMDNLHGLPTSVREDLLSITDEPLKGESKRKFNQCVTIIRNMIISRQITIIN